MPNTIVRTAVMIFSDRFIKSPLHANSLCVAMNYRYTDKAFLQSACRAGAGIRFVFVAMYAEFVCTASVATRENAVVPFDFVKLVLLCFKIHSIPLLYVENILYLQIFFFYYIQLLSFFQ